MEVNNKCIPCKEEGLEVQADGLCKQCEEIMCNNCFKSHAKWRQFRNHSLLTKEHVDVYSKQSVKQCNEHNETIKFYCSKDMEVGCAECMVLKHNGCQILYIKNVAKDVKGTVDIGRTSKELKNLDQNSRQCSEFIAVARRNSNETIDKMRKEVETIRHGLEDYITKAEAGIIKDLLQKEEEDNSLLNQLEKENNDWQLEIEEMTKLLDNKVFSDDELFINIIKIKSRISMARMHVYKIQDKTDINLLQPSPFESLRKACHEAFERLQAELHPTRFQVFVHVADVGKRITLWVQPEFSVRKVKEMLQEKCDIPIETQLLKLKFIGKILEDHLHLQDYGIFGLSDLELKQWIKSPTEDSEDTNQDKKSLPPKTESININNHRKR